MELHDQRYIVGIDLGTTNSAVSYVDLSQAEANRRIRRFKIRQLTGTGEVTGLPVLPSFLYIPGPYDISAEALTLPWKSPEDHFAGAFARDHGAKVPARLVSSAKSWLCHPNADRKAPILPWGASEEVAKVSPVQATCAYLRHIRNAWNLSHQDEDAGLEHQIVIITVPASFDEVARELTLEAAAEAGLTDVILLEEPLAAFYSWLMTHEKRWQEFVKPNELILVCDVGGGTTDFTLIYLRDNDGQLGFERIAVGDHLVLGGDNIDLALARRVEMQFAKQKATLTGDRWKTLCHQCRQAKESILNGSEDSAKITLLGEGGKLIGGTLSAELHRKDVVEAVLDGFFPKVAVCENRSAAQPKGITEFGLPYEQQPAITRHIGWFLEKHAADVDRFLGKKRPAPDLILFNGGSLKPDLIQDRIQQAVEHWFQADGFESPRILDNPEPDLAVSLGAAYYGLVKIGRGVRVGSGSPRSYYLEVAKQESEAPDKAPEVICLVERGLEEGSQIELSERKFEVLANQPVRFNIFSSSYRSGDRIGDLLEVDDSFTPMAPIQTIIQYGKKGVKSQIPIHVAAGYTESGTLALSCHSLISDHRWKLQFQLRSHDVPGQVADQEVFDSAQVQAATEMVQAAFLKKNQGDHLAALVKSLATQTERSRDQWPLGFIRELADAMLDVEKCRQMTQQHESRWLNLLGFCMRPGFGDGADPLRMKKIWRLHGQGPRFENRAQVRKEWWILWRRVAGGLTPGQQIQFLQELFPVMLSKKVAAKKITPQERLEIWMAVANMEHVHVKEKVRWGRALLAELKPKKSSPQHFWALSRLGARELLYGSVDRVIPAKEATAWIEALLEKPWRKPRPVGVAMAQLARKTGDRTRDLAPDTIERIRAWMLADAEHADFFQPHLETMQEVRTVAAQEQHTIFGESLPAGMVLNAD